MIIKRLFLLLLPALACTGALPVRAQESQSQLLALIRASRPDTNRIKLLLPAGRYYVLKPGSYKNDLDSAFALLDEAIALSRQLHADSLLIKSLEYKGHCYMEADNISAGMACFREAVNQARRLGNKLLEADAWEYLAFCLPPNNNALITEKLECYNQAKDIYHKIHDTVEEAGILDLIGDTHLSVNKQDLAEKEFLEVVDLYQKAHHPERLFYTYDHLRELYSVKGDLAQQVISVDKMIRSMEAAPKQPDDSQYFYMRAGEAYYNAGLYDQSLAYCRKPTYLSKNRYGSGVYYDLFTLIIDNLLQKDSAGAAYDLLISTSARYPPAGLIQREYVAYYSGLCNTALKRYPMAEKELVLAIALNDSIQKERFLTNFYGPRAMGRFLTIGRFYFLTRDYAKAEIYRRKIVLRPNDAVTLEFRWRLELFAAELDSAQGHMTSALQHYQQFHRFHDSLNNVAKLIQIQELQVRYETEKKDADLGEQAANIRLLTRQTALQKLEAEQSMLIRNLMIGGIGILLALIGLVYNRYRLKQRNNQRLERQQAEIAAKNSSLEQQQVEISAKNRSLEKLLRDNERLLREVHHRVKNNLQVVMSLLNSQSAYLKDAAALSAVMESHHRVQAMSLIHQKLYKSNNMAVINMREYIGDLLDYLADGLKTNFRVRFNVEIDPILLDVSQAVPVGLIINEVVTNAYKYAFPHTAEDAIWITMVTADGNGIVLEVADNGKGFVPSSNPQVSDSFGMILINGLVEDLDGTLEISAEAGTTYTITFPHFTLSGNSSFPQE
jgi:two-component system, sensor histidine kinase PdtaS